MIRALHLLLAVHLLISTVGVGVFEHVCQMHGRSVSPVAPVDACCAKKAKDCESPAAALTSDPARGPVMTKAPCCRDHARWLQADLDGTIPTDMVAGATPAAIAPPVLAKAEVPTAPAVATLSLKIVRAMRYKPPCPDVDVRVRVQSFLI